MDEKIAITPNFIKTWADKIKQLGLITPAILLLETNKPLSFSVSQLLLLGQPALNIFLPNQFTSSAIDLFASRQNLEQLIRELEER